MLAANVCFTVQVRWRRRCWAVVRRRQVRAAPARFRQRRSDVAEGHEQRCARKDQGAHCTAAATASTVVARPACRQFLVASSSEAAWFVALVEVA